MAKRKSGDSSDPGKSKKGKYTGSHNIEPAWSGVYVTCVRGHESQCRNEMMNVFSEYTDILYGDATTSDLEEDNDAEIDIEAAIAKELDEMKEAKSNAPFSSIDIGCECVLFFRTKKPIVPVDLVLRICNDAKESKIKKTRYAQRLTPITKTATANIDGLRRLATELLKPHFHADEGQEPFKFAIRPTFRNHNVLNRDDVIQTVAEIVGRDHGHSVDLKKYDKLILVECFKSSLGISVVDTFDALERFNLQQIFEKSVQAHAEQEVVELQAADNKSDDIPNEGTKVPSI